MRLGKGYGGGGEKQKSVVLYIPLERIFLKQKA